MDTLDYDYRQHTNDQGDKSLFVNFYNSTLKNETKSSAEGRPIYDETVFVKIFMPGDRTNVIDRPLRESDKLRFPEQYARFKNAQEEQATGTPLKEWPIVSRSMAEELKYFGFTTVDQIANAGDAACSKMMGLQDLKNKAKAYLELAAGNTAPIEQMAARQKELEGQNHVLKDAVDQMKAQITQMQAMAASAKTAGKTTARE